MRQMYLNLMSMVLLCTKNTPWKTARTLSRVKFPDDRDRCLSCTVAKYLRILRPRYTERSLVKPTRWFPAQTVTYCYSLGSQTEDTVPLQRIRSETELSHNWAAFIGVFLLYFCVFYSVLFLLPIDFSKKISVGSSHLCSSLEELLGFQTGNCILLNTNSPIKLNTTE